MSDKVFLDTNVLVYSYSSTEPEKQKIAQKCVTDNDGHAWVSTQVLNEFNSVLYRKFTLPYRDILLAMDELEAIFQVTLVSSQTIRQALLLGDRYQYSYFDSLILASALEQGCTVLYSEDMQNRQKIAGQLEIINPFVA